jgi:hypothetical protein
VVLVVVALVVRLGRLAPMARRTLVVEAVAVVALPRLAALAEKVWSSFGICLMQVTVSMSLAALKQPVAITPFTPSTTLAR